jgi:hypothetical protein
MPEALDLNPEQLRTLRHMLGIDTPDDRVPKPYRDYYCANPGDPELAELEALGAVRCYGRSRSTTGVADSYLLFTTTEAGRAAAMASHRTIRHTKARRVYRRFLDVRDALSDVTFHQFLTEPRFAETRRAA